MPAASASVRRPAARRPAVARVRWDRLGRVAMLCVMAVLAYLYLSAGLTLLSSWRESKRDSGQVIALERESRLLQRQHAAVSGQGALDAQARRLGMIRPGEQGYVVSGLPAN